MVVKKAKKQKTDDERTIVKNSIDELLKKLSVDGGCEILSTQMDEEVFVVEALLTTEDTGIVIGYHGETLESLQLIMSLCLSRELNKFVRVTLEIGDYRKNRTEWLESMVRNARDRVLMDGQEVLLPNLKSWERRIVHLLLQDDKDVMSESTGEGRERTLVIRPRIAS